MTNFFEMAFLQAQGAAPNAMMMPLLMVGMIVVMYFFMIRPQQKRAKEQKQFAESMGTGDKIITTSGIHGRIIRTNEDATVVIEIDKVKNINITIERQAISMEMTVAYQKKYGKSTSTEVTA